MYGLVVTSAPAEEPVSVDRAKLHLRVSDAVEDELITEWVKSARELTESHAGRRWLTQGLRLSLPGFYRYGGGDGCGVVRLPVEPVASVQSVKYYDTAGVLTTLGASLWQTWLEHSPPLLAPAPQKVWPTTETGRLGAVQIEFTAGVATPAEVPSAAKSAILLAVGYWYEHRGDSEDPTRLPWTLGLPPGAKRLLDSIATGAYQAPTG